MLIKFINNLSQNRGLKYVHFAIKTIIYKGYFCLVFKYKNDIVDKFKHERIFAMNKMK